MKIEYKLEGMSCGGCVNSVWKSLMQVTDITDAEVQLNPQRAIITMDRSISIEELQAHLSKAGLYFN